MCDVQKSEDRREGAALQKSQDSHSPLRGRVQDGVTGTARELGNNRDKMSFFSYMSAVVGSSDRVFRVADLYNEWVKECGG